MIKTIKLTGTEQAVTFAGRYQYFHVHNLGGGEVLASLTAGVTRGKDDVLIVPSGSTGYVQMDAARDTIYLAGTGEIQVAGSGNAFSPFKAVLKGGDDITSESGAVAAVTVDYPIVGLNLYGKSAQDGTPSPEAPIPIESIGDDGNVSVTACGKNILMQTCIDETQYGITFTKQPDGSIIMNGTSTANFSYVIYDYNKSNALVLDGGKYTISFGDEFDAWAKSSSATASMVVGYQVGESKKYPCYRKEGTYTFSTDEYVEERNLFVRVTLDAGAVCENVRIYPQIEKGDTATEYEPYTGNTATITSGLPLCSVGDVRDEVVFNADGTGKIIKRLGIYTIAEGDRITIQENAGEYRRFQYVTKCTPGEALCTSYKYGTGFATASPTTNIDQYAGYFTVFNGTIRFISNELTVDEFIANNLGVTVVYQLDEPQEIALSAAEMAALAELQTFEGVTNIFNDEGAKMSVKAATNPLLSEFVKPIIDRLITRIENLEAATLSMGGNV